MPPLPYWPFEMAATRLQMGLHPLTPDDVIACDPAHYRADIALKGRLMRANEASYCRSLPGQHELIADTLDLLLPMLARRYPTWFHLSDAPGERLWINGLLGTTATLAAPDAGEVSRLRWLGNQVQEDLLILADDPAAGYPLVAGHLCFPNDWGIAQKLGQPLLQIHTPVPHFGDELGTSITRLFERLKTGQSVWRLNWSVKANPRLNLLPAFASETAVCIAALRPATIGEQIFLRIERQTLTRLPRTRAILFTVHTYQAPLAAAIVTPDHAAQMAAALRAAPADLLRYKGMEAYGDRVQAYLATKAMR